MSESLSQQDISEIRDWQQKIAIANLQQWTVDS